MLEYDMWLLILCGMVDVVVFVFVVVWGVVFC